jgi:hypothetical protein
MSTSVKPSFEEDEEEDSPVLDLAVLTQGKWMAVENLGSAIPVTCQYHLLSHFRRI